MIESIVVVILGFILLFGLSFLLLLLRDRITRPSKKKLEEYSNRFSERIKSPDFGAVEKHFGHSLPECVKALYLDQEEITRGEFEVAERNDAEEEDRWYIAFYMPADGETVSISWPGIEKYFPFADDGFGNGYLIDPTEEDPPVLFHDHETGDLSEVCANFSEFMKWPRLEPTED